MKTLNDALAAIVEAGTLEADEARERYALAMDIVLVQLRNRESDEARQVLHQVVEFLADHMQ